MTKKTRNLSCYTPTTPTTTQTTPTPPESQLQAACFQWAWNDRPETRRLLAYNLNNSANKIAGNRNKALGLIRGRADMELLWSGRLHYAEFKTDTGRQSPEQIRFEHTVTQHGATYTVIRSVPEFKTWLDNIVKCAP
jgi:hypothetical protein